VSANSPIDRVIGVTLGLSPHSSSFNLLLQKALQSVLNFGQNVSWKSVIAADLLHTLLEAADWA